MLLQAAFLAHLALASAIPHVREQGSDLAVIEKRSTAASYAPTSVACPANFSIRQPAQNDTIGSEEAAYIQQHKSQNQNRWQSYLSALNLTGVDSSNTTLPTFGIAVSGGGTRATLNGGAILNGFDERNSAAVQAKTGGILQLSSYLAGLSGGGWLVSSMILNDFPTTPSLNESNWMLQESLVNPPSSVPDAGTEIVTLIQEKAAAGFPISFVDFWGRVLSYHFNTNDSSYGATTLFGSGVTQTSAFQNAEMPFPILVSTSQVDGHEGAQFAGPIYQFTPFEFGVADPSINAFVNISYMGTSASKGSVSGNCTQGFDNAGFIFGSSSDIWAEAEAEQNLANSLASSVPGLTELLANVSSDVVDTGRVPNSFQGLGTSSYAESTQSELNLVDGGIAGENIPFFPLILPSRAVDAIIAIDSSNDEAYYPNGTAPYTSYLKSQLPQFAAYPFPAIPEAYPNDTFATQGYNSRPTFFGCNITDAPLIVYLPNYFQTYNGTDTSTFQPTYTSEQIDGFFDNGFAIATQSKGNTVDANFPQCLACALIDRQISRNNGTRPAECQSCFTKYCA